MTVRINNFDKESSANAEDRICFINKIHESATDCRTRCVTQAQNEAHMIPCIRKDIDMTDERVGLKQPGIYDTELADIALIAIAKGIKKTLLIFNSNNTIYVIRAEEY